MWKSSKEMVWKSKASDGAFWRLGASMLFGIGVWLYWWLLYPHALSYQEQYQLFQLTGDYFCERMSLAGGLADWLGEFVTQFYYIPGVGAWLLAMLYVGLQRLTAGLMGRRWFVFSFVPPLLLLWLMGDESVLVSYPMALLLVMQVAWLQAKKFNRNGSWIVEAVVDGVLVVLLFWLAGPAVWLYALLRVVQMGGGEQGRWTLAAGCRAAGVVCWTLLVMLVARATVLQQWPLQEVLLTMTYYRIPMQVPVLLWLLPLVIAGMVAFGRWCRDTKGNAVNGRRALVGWNVVAGAACVVLGWLAVTKGFPRDKYELIREDYLVRTEQWGEIVERAQRYQVPTAFSSVCVNLALGMRHELADRMFSFYQSGEDALIMPRYRDLTSDLPSAEAFWRLGFVNSAQRYMFDVQESILNGKKSSRCTQRIAECMIVNGHYTVARKHLALLKNTLFYRSWAENAEKYLFNDAWVNTHPVWGRLRRLRYKENYLFSYAEIDTMFGLLYENNHENWLALDYFMGQLLLKGNVQGFMQYMKWVQQSGFYKDMPIGYQDAVRCIQQQGNVPGSNYAAYARKMSRGE